MGNSLRGIGLLSNGDCSYHVKLGKSAAIDLTERTVEQENDGGFSEKWKASYTIDGSACKLSISKRVGKDGQCSRVYYTLQDDDICSGCGFRWEVGRTETGLLAMGGIVACESFLNMMSAKISKTTNAWGGVKETHVSMYGSGSRSKGGLLVMEWKKKSRDESPYMGTLAHYYATSTGNVFTQAKTDIGLSVVAKIGVSDNAGLDFTVEGPVQHPAAALFYMFEEVMRTGIWKPTACPHCANIQRQRSTFWQSESEDSDRVPAARLHGHRQNGGGVLANDGSIKGNNNGNLKVRQLIFRGR